ncbi:MAG: SMC-Scp complex subunit ScpB [Defluviitaleaceae bacterium]|nr:SMC-Scp complex subunit ScpB [Defluviitaleaceae bacterium]
MPTHSTEKEKMLEAMLFANPGSIPLASLAEALGCDIPLTRNLLTRMTEAYAKAQSGIQIQEINDTYRLCTNPIYYAPIERLLKLKPRRALTQTLLETLAIIAYKQPVTKSVIEDIRGVNADHAVNRLMEYGLITEKGRLDAPGRPILFGTSDEFLLYYGLKNVQELLAHSGGGPLQLTLEDSDAAPKDTAETQVFEAAPMEEGKYSERT